MTTSAPRSAAPDGPLPVLAIQSAVVFPRSVATLDVVHPENLAALELHPGGDAPILAAPLREAGDGPRRVDQLLPVATVCRLLDRIRQPDGSERIVLQGRQRVALEELERRGGAFQARCQAEPATAASPEELRENVERVMALVDQLVVAEPRTSHELPKLLALERSDPAGFADLLASRLHLSYREGARLHAELDLGRRLERMLAVLARDLARAEASEKLQSKVRARARRSWLREQLAVIQGELGEGDPLELELADFGERIGAVALSGPARKRLTRELLHLRRAAPGSGEAGRLRAWIEWVLELPWELRSPEPEPDDARFEAVMAQLDISHTGLVDVKSRVTEFLAVQHLGGGSRGTVLCFHGPPGTGKTSLARSVARALGREFARVSVGGAIDEAALKGDPSTIPGGEPGRVLAELARVGTKNPVVLIEEIDKAVGGEGAESGGVLLELLDPEQNRSFVDRYLGVPFDLSECIFLATANDVHELPDALVDRLELVAFESYTETDKLAIAREHLVPAAREQAALEREQFGLTQGALLEVLRKYTEEAGVRQLARALDSLARKAAVEVVHGKPGLRVRKADLAELLGPPRVEEEVRLSAPRVGVATGLAWTVAGGALLPIEALAMPGSGRSILTGSIGDVMRESVATATSWVRARLGAMGLAEDTFEKLDVHLHFPSSATPKDGPSAGLAITVALVSMLTGVPARHDVAMTGEISLHGSVLPIGGLREKLLAALRAGVRTALVPARNSEEILKLPPEVRQRLDICIVDDVREVLEKALLIDSHARAAANARRQDELRMPLGRPARRGGRGRKGGGKRASP